MRTRMALAWTWGRLRAWQGWCHENEGTIQCYSSWMRNTHGDTIHEAWAAGHACEGGWPTVVRCERTVPLWCGRKSLFERCLWLV